MSPLYLDGDELTIDTTSYQNNLPKVGDNVMLKHPFIKDYYMIKQIESVTADGRYFVVGINKKASTDSRSFGAISPDLIIGKVTNHIERRI